jgi:hypothetical protein
VSTRRSRLFPPPADASGKPKRNKGRGESSRLTRLGRVGLRRTRYFDPLSGASDAPMDRLIDEADRLITLGVTELACRLAIDSASFERAAGNLLRAAGLSISEESLRKMVEHEGKLLLAAQQAEQLELDFAACDCTTADTPEGAKTTRVYAGSDGVKVPVITDAEKRKRRAKAVEKRKGLPRRRGLRRRPLATSRGGADQPYKEFKIVTYYDQQHERRWVRATRKDHNAAGKLMRQGAAQLHLRAAGEKVAIIDGAEWIRSQFQRNVPYLDALVLDFYHLAEHVHAARRIVFGEDNQTGKAWAEQLLHGIKHEGYEPFWSKLTQTRAGLRSPGKRTAMDGLMHYVAQRREMLDYVRCQKMGWDIGSGSTESMCKALTRRLKQRGMRWDADNAEAIMALETLEQTAGWPAWHRCRAQSVN